MSNMSTVASVHAYIAAQPAAAQPRLRELRAIIRGVVPEAVETMGYDMPTYKLANRAVYFGAWKRHCALYGCGVDDFAEELRGFDTGKGCVRFPLGKPIPEALVRKMVQARFATR
jgi:uncharacterized protein YdhG (YjbR/CyaY superfamily)